MEERSSVYQVNIYFILEGTSDKHDILEHHTIMSGVSFEDAKDRTIDKVKKLMKVPIEILQSEAIEHRTWLRPKPQLNKK